MKAKEPPGGLAADVIAVKLVLAHVLARTRTDAELRELASAIDTQLAEIERVGGVGSEAAFVHVREAIDDIIARAVRFAAARDT